MVAELVEDLIHLEGGEDGFDEDCSLDGVPGEIKGGFGDGEDVVPEAGFEVRLHLGEVEVRAGAAVEEFFRVVEQVEAEVEQAARHGDAVDEEVSLLEMPASCADEEDGHLVVELIGLLRFWIFVGDGAPGRRRGG